MLSVTSKYTRPPYAGGRLCPDPLKGSVLPSLESPSQVEVPATYAVSPAQGLAVGQYLTLCFSPCVKNDTGNTVHTSNLSTPEAGRAL